VVLICTVGEYMLVSMALITFDSRADEGYKGLESGGSGLQLSLGDLGFLLNLALAC
jgi:hypothetical protein